MSLQYKLDNEFELVFVVAYQNILKLTYIDKFLTEIQLRFRDKYKQVIQNGQFNFNFDEFKNDFDEILKECETEARRLNTQAKQPRKYEESEKSTKTVGSMIEHKQTFLGSLVSSSGSPNTGKHQSPNKNTKKNDQVIDNNKSKDETSHEANGTSNGADIPVIPSSPTSGVKTMRGYVPKNKSYVLSSTINDYKVVDFRSY